jgi:hypothetical protein
MIFIEQTGMLIFPAIYLAIAAASSAIALGFVMHREKSNKTSLVKSIG